MLRPLVTRLLPALLLGATSLAQAANPATGTLTPAAPSITYTSGPFTQPNQSGTAGDVTCDAALNPCDQFGLTVTLPNDGKTYRMKVSTAWANPGEDYDIYLLEGTSDAAQSAGSSNPEAYELTAKSASFTLRIVPYLPAGGTTTTTVTLTEVLPTSGVDPSTYTAKDGFSPRYKLHVSPPTLGDAAGEPTLGYNPLTKRVMFIAFTQALRVTFQEDRNFPPAGDRLPADPLNATLPASCDATWEDKSGTLTTLNTLDPLMTTDPVSGRTFNSQLSGANSLFEYSDDDGNTWTPGQIGPANGGADHQGMTTGPYPAGPQYEALKALYGQAFYYCSQSVAAAFCARSDDGAQTQGPGTVFKNTDCAAGGLHGHPKVGPDGRLFIPDSSQCILGLGTTVGVGDGSSEKVITFISADAGTTYSVSALPQSSGGAGSDPSIHPSKADAAGNYNTYMCYENGDSHLRIAVSKDKGATWVNDFDVGAIANIKQSRFPAMIAGDPNRAACVFHGTTTEGNGNSLDFKGVWHTYMATTFDAGLTWHVSNLTGVDPIQGFGGVGPDGTNRNLLDFIDLEIDEQGRPIAALADGCTGACTSDPSANTFADNGIVARQTGGRTLFAAFDNKAGTQYNSSVAQIPAAACAVQGESLRIAGQADVVWRAPDNGASDITNYEVFRSASPTGPFSKVGDAGPKLNFVDKTTDDSVTSYYYRVTAENAVGKAVVGNIIKLDIVVPTVINTCVLPGQKIAVDDLGDGSADDTDIEFVAVAELPAMPDDRVVTYKLAGFTGGQPPPTSFYVLLFPTRGNFYLAANSAGGTPVYEYGTYSDPAGQGVLQFTAEGELGAESSFDEDGTIRMIVPKSLFGSPAVGASINGFEARARIGSSAATSRDTASGAVYTIRGTAICALNTAPLAVLEATPKSGNAPLTVGFGITGTDSDAGDSAATYSLDFGDGSAAVSDQPITGGMVALSHVYQASGNYAARLTVKDSRGLISSNVATQFISVAAAGGGSGSGGSSSGSVSSSGGPSPVTPAAPGDSSSTQNSHNSGRFGGGTFGLFALLPLLLMATRRRRS